MKDEWNNEAPYDFKNVLFRRYLITSVNDSEDHPLVGTYGLPSEAVACEGSDWIWCYTFHGQDYADLGLDEPYDFSAVNLCVTDAARQQFDGLQLFRLNECGGNVIKPCMDDIITFSVGIFKLPNNVFFCAFTNTPDESVPFLKIGMCEFNVLRYDCFSNTFGTDCNSNTFGTNCNFNTFGTDCYSNTFSVSNNDNFKFIKVESNINNKVFDTLSVTSSDGSLESTIPQYVGKDSSGNVVKKNPFDPSSFIA